MRVFRAAVGREQSRRRRCRSLQRGCWACCSSSARLATAVFGSSNANAGALMRARISACVVASVTSASAGVVDLVGEQHDRRYEKRDERRHQNDDHDLRAQRSTYGAQHRAGVIVCNWKCAKPHWRAELRESVPLCHLSWSHARKPVSRMRASHYTRQPSSLVGPGLTKTGELGLAESRGGTRVCRTLRARASVRAVLAAACAVAHTLAAQPPHEPVRLEHRAARSASRDVRVAARREPEPDGRFDLRDHRRGHSAERRHDDSRKHCVSRRESRLRATAPTSGRSRSAASAATFRTSCWC